MQLKLRAVDVIFHCIVVVPLLAISSQKHLQYFCLWTVYVSISVSDTLMDT